MTHGLSVAVDLDGVLADFSGRVRQLIDEYEGRKGIVRGDIDVGKDAALDKKIMWKVIHNYDSHTPFFYTLEKMPDADVLFDFILENFDHDDISILSASGHTPSDAPMQKRRWVRRHFGDYHVEVVAKSPDKAAFATPTSILIDDREKSLDPWIAAGGIGILHTDARSTIEQLQKLIGSTV
jgi:5'(3')-deoxyribonucleotidase